MASKSLPGLGGDPSPLKPLDRERRAAYAGMFPNLYDVTANFCVSGGLGHTIGNAKTSARAVALMNAGRGWPTNGVEVMAAYFAAMVLRQRGRMEREARDAINLRKPAALELFAAHAHARFLALSSDLFEEFEVVSSGEAQNTFVSYTQMIMVQILNSIDAEYGLLGGVEWDETEFFRSVFLGLADKDRTGALVRGFQVAFLDHLDDYRAAVAQDMEAGARVPTLTVHEGGKTG